jgi:hypothetical protein
MLTALAFPAIVTVFLNVFVSSLRDKGHKTTSIAGENRVQEENFAWLACLKRDLKPYPCDKDGRELHLDEAFKFSLGM